MGFKVVVVTGAGSGVGAATARLFSHQGHNLVLCGRNEANLQQTADGCFQSGSTSQIVTVKADITQSEDCANVINETIRRFGQMDILIHSAGILANATVEKVDMKVYEEIMKTNLQAVVLLTSLAIPHLTKTKGNIVIVSSFSGLRPTSGVLYYALSKSAVDQFTRVAASELGPKGIRVNSVNPGVLDTGMHLKTSSLNEKSYAELIESQRYMVPLGRAGTAEEIASVIGFLASDEASYVTGVNLLADGGRFCFTPRSVPLPKL